MDGKEGKKGSGGARKIILLVPFVLFAVIFGALTLSVFAGSLGAAVGGVFEFIAAIAGFNTGFWATAAKIGVGIGCVGAGILLFVLGMKMFEACRRMFTKYFGRKTEKGGDAA